MIQTGDGRHALPFFYPYYHLFVLIYTICRRVLIQYTVKKNVANTTIIVMSFSLITRLIAFLFKVFLSRTLGAEPLGLFSMGLAIFGLLTMIPSSGIPLAVSRRVAEAADGKSAHATISAGLVLTVVVNLVTVGLFYLMRHPLLGLFADQRAEKVVLVMLPATFSTAVYNVLRAYMMGRKHYIGYSVTETFEEIVNVVVVLLIMYGGIVALEGGEALAVAFLIGDVATLLLLVVLYVAIGGRMARPRGLVPIVKSSTPITLMRLFTSLAATFTAILLPNRLVATGMAVNEATAAYGTAVGMAYPLLFAPLAITSALSVVLLPELAQLNKAGRLREVSGKIDVGIHYILVISAFFFIIYATLGTDLGVLIYDNRTAGQFVTFAAGLVFPLTLTQLTNTALNSLGLELRCFVNSLIGLAVMGVCLWFLPAVLGIYALAVAQTAFFLISFVANLLVLSKHHATSLAFVRPFLKIAVGALSIAACVYLLRLWLASLDALVGTILLGAIAALSYAALILLTKSVDIHVIFGWLRKKHGKRTN